jgi:hypothetical protein
MPSADLEISRRIPLRTHGDRKYHSGKLIGSAAEWDATTFGTVETACWKNNPGSQEHVPKSAGAMKALTQEQVADAIVRGIERGQRAILQPGMFKLLFVLNAVFPATVSNYVAGRGP